MSLQFNVTTSPYNGIIQRIEQEVYGIDSLGTISDNSKLLGQWTTSVNLALTDAFRIIFESDGRWQFDDTNHSDLPIIYTNLVSGQRTYTFDDDETGNLILDIENVSILRSATETEYETIHPRDISNDRVFNPFVRDNSSETGVPLWYDKHANAITFDVYPDYSATNGIKIYISREGSFFTTSDTTKKPGIDARFHEYLVLKPALNNALAENLATANGLALRVQQMEEDMRRVYTRRTQDERHTMTYKKINYI